MIDSDIEQALCSVLSGVQEPSELSPARLDELWARMPRCTSGVGDLLARVLTAPGCHIDSASRARAVARLRDAAVSEMLRHRVLCRIVNSFDSTATRMLLMKGAGLACTGVSGPYWRWRAVTTSTSSSPARRASRLRRRRSRQPVSNACGSPDASSLPACSGITCPARRPRRRVLRRPLHWRIANRHVFSHALSFDDAWDASQPVPRLGGAARTLGPADALLLACIHRIAHHTDDPDRLWLWDIHLLAGSMTSADVDALAARAARSDMRAVVARGLELARARFGTTVEPRLWTELPQCRRCPGGVGRFHRRAAARQLDLVLSDLGAVATTTEHMCTTGARASISERQLHARQVPGVSASPAAIRVSLPHQPRRAEVDSALITDRARPTTAWRWP